MIAWNVYSVKNVLKNYFRELGSIDRSDRRRDFLG